MDYREANRKAPKGSTISSKRKRLIPKAPFCVGDSRLNIDCREAWPFSPFLGNAYNARKGSRNVPRTLTIVRRTRSACYVTRSNRHERRAKIIQTHEYGNSLPSKIAPHFKVISTLVKLYTIYIFVC